MSYPKLEKEIIVFYHARCVDGFSAAWVAHEALGEEAQYVSLMHNMPLPHDLVNKTVYFLDIAPDMPEFAEVKDKNTSIIVLDHHVSRESVTKAANEFVYGTDQSGVGVTWQYFFKDKPLPLFLQYVQESDLNPAVKSAEGRALLTYAEIVPFEFEQWARLVEMVEEPEKRQLLIEKGNLLGEYRAMIIKDMVGNANKITFAGTPGHVVNSAFSNIDTSLASAVMEHYGDDLAVIWYETQNRIKVSMRSRGEVDVSKIAEQYGGGGHVHASGFQLPLGARFPWQYE